MKVKKTRFTITLIISAFATCALVSQASAQMGRGMGPDMMGWGWWGMGWIFMIIFWGLVIAGLIFLIRWLAGLGRSRPSHDKAQDSALEILRQRYAKGEINKDEFEEKKRDLM